MLLWVLPWDLRQDSDDPSQWDILPWSISRAASRGSYGPLYKAVNQLLKTPDENIMQAARMVSGQPSAVSEPLIEAIVQQLRDPDKVPRLAMIIALQLHSVLPEKILKAMAECITKDPEDEVSRAVVRTIGVKGWTVPEEVIETIAAQLGHPDGYAREAAVNALTRYPVWPQRAVEAVAAWLDDPEYEVRRCAAVALDTLSTISDTRISSFLADMSHRAFLNLYEHWLMRSFQQTILWSVDGDRMYLDVPGRFRDFPGDGLEDKVKEAQTWLAGQLHRCDNLDEYVGDVYSFWGIDLTAPS